MSTTIFNPMKILSLIAMETKMARSVPKGVATRKINEITDLMTDKNNVDEVNRTSNELTNFKPRIGNFIVN